MKVTFCSWDKPDHCIAQNIWLQQLLPQLRQCGIDCGVLFLTIGQPEQCPTYTKLRQAGFNCCATANLGSTRNFVRWILKKIAENPPHVFVPNHVLPAYYASRWLREAGIPAVGVLHSQDTYCQKLIEQFGSADNNSRVSAFVAVSKHIEQIARSKVTQNVQIKRIPCGPPVPSFVAKYPDGPFRLVYAGRLEEEAKRCTLVADALCCAVSQIPNTEALIYGEGAAKKAVEQVICKKGKGLSVYMVTAVENTEIQRHLAQCHSFVLLSDYEGTPIALMEAMACGVVPICLRIPGGVEELVEDGVTGLLVDDRENSFVAAVQQLRKDPKLWQRLSQAARLRIKEKFSSDVCAAKWESMLRNLYDQNCSKASLKIPFRLNLPPVYPEFASRDPRKPFYFWPLGLLRHQVMRYIWLLKRWLAVG